MRLPRRISKYIVWIFSLSLGAYALSDNRCYLETGASSETFFVSESETPGSVIGEIRIHGDPRPAGSISLRLKEHDSPVEITPGTKNLTLKRKLDKEGVDGPSSVFINVICERFGTRDPGFIIPVNVRVTDANDNSPVFINAPYVLNISEVTVVGTRVLQGVHAIDNDQQGPFAIVKYSVLSGPYSDYFEFENELEGTLVLRKSLDYESLRNFDVHIRAQDHGEVPKKTDTVLTVHVIDADDQNPKFMDDRYISELPSPAKQGTFLTIKPREIKAYDQDIGINAPIYYTFNEIGMDYAFFRIQRLTGKISLAKDISDNDLPHPAILVIRATQQDNPDRYALATLTVSRNPTEDGIRFLHRKFYINASEALPVGALVGTLTNSRPGEQLKYFVSDQEILKIFTLTTKGEMFLKRKLDYEERSEYIFKVFTTDGVTNDSCIVNITVENVNEWEPRFRYPLYEFFVGNKPNDHIGKIEAADGDKNEKLRLTLAGLNASLFYITPSGDLKLKGGDPNNYKGNAYLTVTAADTGNPPKTATVPITVHFPGALDAAGITSSRSNDNLPHLIVGLGAALLLLVVVVGLLIVYICKVKKKSSQTGSLNSGKLPTALPKKTTSNPVFATPSASMMGGIPTGAKSKITSPKVYPAPQPPVQWPISAESNRVKKLNWGDDKTDSDSIENAEQAPKLFDNTNLTVYF